MVLRTTQQVVRVLPSVGLEVVVQTLISLQKHSTLGQIVQELMVLTKLSLVEMVLHTGTLVAVIVPPLTGM